MSRWKECAALSSRQRRAGCNFLAPKERVSKGRDGKTRKGQGAVKRGGGLRKRKREADRVLRGRRVGERAPVIRGGK